MIVWSRSALARAGLTVAEAEVLALSATQDPPPALVVGTQITAASVVAEVERYLALYDERRPK